jgi:hypothetical protein
MSTTAEVIAETSGFCVGRNWLLALNGTWPFGRLEIHSDRLVLNTLFRRYTFSRDSIISLSIFSWLFSRGLRIEHSISGYPPFVVFWSFHSHGSAAGCPKQGFLSMTPRPNQSMKPTAPLRSDLSVFGTTPCPGLSLSR